MPVQDSCMSKDDMIIYLLNTLSFYADKDNWDTRNVALLDRGNRASEALIYISKELDKQDNG
jgi:hypothetical protein